jgi:hypothetical protein
VRRSKLKIGSLGAVCFGASFLGAAACAVDSGDYLFDDDAYDLAHDEGHGNAGEGTGARGDGGDGNSDPGSGGAAGDPGFGGGGAGTGMGGSGDVSGSGGSDVEPPDPVCGNDDVESGEECDDGNTQTEVCTYGEEECVVCDEDCNEVDGSVSYCGDGDTDEDNDEECDDGNSTTETCPYGDQTECWVCNSSCKYQERSRWCGDSTTDAGQEDCDDGNTSTETCDYNESCNVCDSTCHTVAGDGDYCGDAVVNAPRYVNYLETTCPGGGIEPNQALMLNGMALPTPMLQGCTCGDGITYIGTSDPQYLNAVRANGNWFSWKPDPNSYLSWAILYLYFSDGGQQQIILDWGNPGDAEAEAATLCAADFVQGTAFEVPFDVPDIEQCDGPQACSNCSWQNPANPPAVLGPTFPGWTQCEGYLDTAAGEEIPDVGWADDCRGEQYAQSARLVCGSSRSNYRYIDLTYNVFRDEGVGFPSNDIISASKNQADANFTLQFNRVYDEFGAPIDVDRSWWGGSAGCVETTANLTINNGCGWEAADCFGLNLAGDRFLWVYVK